MTNTFNTGDPEQALRRLLATVFGPMITSGGLPTFQPSTLTTDAFATEGFPLNTAGDELVYTNQAAAVVGPFNQGDGMYWVGLHRDIHTDVAPWVRQASTHYVWQRTGVGPLDPAPAPIDGLGIFATCTVSGGAITAVTQPIVPATRFQGLGVHPDPSNPVPLHIAGDGRIVWNRPPTGEVPEGRVSATLDVNGDTFTIGAEGIGGADGANNLTMNGRTGLRLSQNSVILLALLTGNVILPALPTSAPATSGALWNNGGVVNIVP